MYPILLKINGFSLYSLGALVAFGFFMAFFIIWCRLREIGLEEEKIIDSFLLSSLVAILWSRIFYIVLNFGHFGFSPFRWLYLNQYPGLSFWGALLGFLVSFWFYCRREKWDFPKVVDELVFGLVPFSFFAHLGMFLDGSNLGDETGLFWGIFFPGDMVRRHPICLFLAIFFLILEIYFSKIEKTWRGWDWYKSHKQGFLILNFLILTVLVNFILAFLKPKGLYSVLIEKITSLIVFFAAVIELYWLSGRKIRDDLLFSKRKKIINFEK